MNETIFNLRVQVVACRRDIRSNGDGFVGFFKQTLKSEVLADLRHRLWVARMKANN